MPYVYERVSKEDIETYNPDRFNRPTWMPAGLSRWIINKEKNIYLRNVYDYMDRDGGV